MSTKERPTTAAQAQRALRTRQCVTLTGSGVHVYLDTDDFDKLDEVFFGLPTCACIRDREYKVGDFEVLIPWARLAPLEPYGEELPLVIQGLEKTLRRLRRVLAQENAALARQE